MRRSLEIALLLVCIGCGSPSFTLGDGSEDDLSDDELADGSASREQDAIAPSLDDATVREETSLDADTVAPAPSPIDATAPDARAPAVSPVDATTPDARVDADTVDARVPDALAVTRDTSTTDTSPPGPTDASLAIDTAPPRPCPGVCSPLSQSSEDCGVGGRRVRTCSETCTWNPFGPCEEPQLWFVRSASNGSRRTTAIERIALDGSSRGAPLELSSEPNPFSVLGDVSSSRLLELRYGGAGHLLRSGDGRYVTLAGYIRERTIAFVRIDGAARVETVERAGIAETVGFLRSAYTTDGDSLWLAGTAGVFATDWRGAAPQWIMGSSQAAALPFGGDLFVSGGGLAQRLDGLPRRPSPPTKLGTANALNEPRGSHGIWAFDRSGTGIDTVYLAYDDGPSVHLRRFVRQGSTWSEGVRLSNGVWQNLQIRYMTGRIEAGKVVLYATSSGDKLARVLRIEDDVTSANILSIREIRASEGVDFRGIAFAPR
jgi:hypothetical protein